MLRLYFLQQWFNLADPAVEEALYDSATLRQFAGIDLGAEPVPPLHTTLSSRPERAKRRDDRGNQGVTPAVGSGYNE
jgi:IS5 family transposase